MCALRPVYFTTLKTNISAVSLLSDADRQRRGETVVLDTSEPSILRDSFQTTNTGGLFLLDRGHGRLTRLPVSSVKVKYADTDRLKI